MGALRRRAYALLLRCYPRAFRDEYERDLLSDFDRLWNARAPDGKKALTVLSLSVLVDTLATAFREHLSILSADVRVGARTLRRVPAFAIGVVGTLALGIGATTAIFSVVYAVLFRPLPFVEADQLVELVETKPADGISAFAASGPDFQSWRERARSFVDLAALSDRDVNLSDDHEPERLDGLAVTSRMFSLLGVRPIVGRTFDDREEKTPSRVVMISDGLHRRRYGGNPALIGRTVEINGIPHTVIGVVPNDMGFVQGKDVWLPFVPDSQNRGDRQLDVIARLKPGIRAGQASAELESIAASLAREFPETNSGYSARVRPLLDLAVTPGIGRTLVALLAAVGLLLLIACANVAHLLLTRAVGRRGELAMRRALGAGSARLTRLVTTEAFLLMFVGGACGVVLAAILVRLAQPTLAALLPRAHDISLDWPVLGAATLATAVTGLVFGLVPAWRVMRGDVTDAVNASSRIQSDRSHAALRRGFVVGQFALASVLVTGAVLLSQSLVRMTRVDPGFRTDHLLMMGVTVPAGVAGQEARVAFFRRLVEQVSAVPGVTSAALGWNLPLRPGAGGPGMEVSASPESVLAAGRAHWRIATPGYFPTMGIPLLRGRLFDEGEPEIANGFRAVILSESLARRLCPADDPLGQQIWLGNGQVRTVIGVVGDVHQTTLADGPTPTMYMPTTWVFPATNMLLVRTAAPPSSLAPAIRRAVRMVDSRQTLFDMQTMDEYVRASMAQPRLNASLVGAFALLALCLGAVGVGGVVAQIVSARRSELAIRMALGGGRSRIIREVAASGIRLCVVGVAVGLATAFATGHAASSLLYQARPGAPGTLALVGAILLIVATIACLVPALRVTRIDPAAALRGQ